MATKILKKQEVKEPEVPMPAGVIAADLKYPEPYSDMTVSFDMYYTNQMGWVICVLPIANNRRGFEQRTYGIQVKGGKMCRVGAGPHVLKKINLKVRKSRAEKLKYLVDLYNKGVVEAHEIRDGRSTRRARGEMLRNQRWGF